MRAAPAHIGSARDVRVKRSVLLALGLVAMSAAIGSTLSFERPRPAPPIRVPAASTTSASTTDAGHVGAADFAISGPGVLVAYAAMRDDINPKPRLQLIDAWAREATPDAPFDLLGQALVDPDESVRARAQDLFERRIQAH
jgi:hypothetical protein